MKSKCTKCGWIGTDDEKDQLYDKKQTKELGIVTHTLRCPRCGGETFYQVNHKKIEVNMGDKDKGIYNKFQVRRTDGQSDIGGKHVNCYHFVLDVNCDPFAAPAIYAYAEACESEYPILASDLRRMVDNNVVNKIKS